MPRDVIERERFLRIPIGYSDLRSPRRVIIRITS